MKPGGSEFHVSVESAPAPAGDKGVGYPRMMDENEAGKRRRVGERRIVQFVTRLLLCMVLRCLGDGRS